MILNFKKSNPAFTLWEVIIAMLITSVVVTLSYGAYRQFTGILDQENRQMDELLRLSELEKDLQRMVSSSDRIEAFEDEILFTSGTGECSLVFDDGLMEIVCDGESVSQLSVLDWSAEYVDDRSDLIRSFRIICKLYNSSFTLTFGKTYMKQFLYTNG